MMETQGRDPCVMHASSSDLGANTEPLKVIQITQSFVEKLQPGGLLPARNRFERRRGRRGRMVDPRVSDDGKKLMNGTPGNRPMSPTPGKLRQRRDGSLVPLAILPVRVDQQVGINRDHDEVGSLL